MADGVISIGTEVDISNLQDGMQEAAASVKASTSQMEAAYAQLAQTTDNYTAKTATVKASTSEMGAAYERLAGATAEYAVTGANLRTVIQQLVSGQVPYTLAVQALTPALVEQTTASRALQAAKQRLAQIEQENTATLTANTLAMTANSVASEALAASQSTVAASARLAGRELGGSVGGQLGLIAARSSALGPILSSPFLMAAPIIAGVGVIAYQLVTKIVDMQKAAQEAAESIDRSWREMTDSIRTSNDSLITQGDHLQSELDKLLGRPGENGMLIAFDEARDAADKLSVSIDRDIDKMLQLLDVANKKNSIGFWQSIWSGRAETTDTQKTISDAVKGIRDVNDEFTAVVQQTAEMGDKNKLADAQQRQLIALQGAYDRAEKSITASLKSVQSQQDSYEESGKTFGKDQTANIELLRNALHALDLEQQNIGEQYRNSNLQQQVTPAKDQHDQQRAAQEAARKAAEEARKADEAAVQAARQSFESLRAAHALTASDEAGYWAEVLVTAQNGSKLYATALDEANRATAKAQEEAQRTLARWTEEVSAQFTKQQEEAQKIQKQQEELANALTASSDRQAEAHAKANQSVAEAQVAAELAAGSITKLAAAQQEAQIHAQAYREELARLDAEITRVNSDAALTPQQRVQQNGQLQAQKIQLQGQAQASGINDQANIQKQIADPYLQAFQQINQGWLQVQNQMMFSTRNIGLAFAKMGQQLVISAIDSAEQWALKWAEKELLTLVVHQTTNAAKTSSDAASNAAAVAAASAANISMAEGYAAVAATAAMASAAAIPVVGWAMAPGVGAAILATGQGFAAMAAFEEGTGYVPRDGMAYLHEGEAVVPAPTMEELRGTGDREGITINHTTNIHAQTERAVIEAIRRNPHEIAGALKRHMRQGGRG